MRAAVLGALLAAAAAAGAAAQPSVIDAHDPALEALARSALPRARVSPLKAQVLGIRGATSATSGRVEAIRNLAQELRAAGLAVTSTDTGLRVTLPENVLFDFDRADLRPDAASKLQLLADGMARAAELPVRVEGHTDAKGADAYNLRLSEARARAVRSWLLGRGVAPARVPAAGFGKTRPIAPNATPDGRDDAAGRQKNRRVEVVIGA